MLRAMAPTAENFHVSRRLTAKSFVMLVMQLQLFVRPMKSTTFTAVASAQKRLVAKTQPVP
jgi:hypothetical protein